MIKRTVINMSVDEEIKVNLSKVLAKGKQQNEKTQNIKIKYVEIDEFLDLIGPFNKAQMLLVAMFCLIIIPSVYQTLIMSFAGNSPPWKCSGSLMSVTHPVFTPLTMNPLLNCDVICQEHHGSL